jgi:UDP-N-acetyl-D-mannosaminuronic acid dehydrogenase
MARFKTVIKKDCKIIDAVGEMSSTKNNNYIAGIAVIVDDEDKVVGVLTDGDIRRGISKKISIDESVDAIASFKPMTLAHSGTNSEMKAELIRLSRKRDIDYRKFTSIVITDENGRLYDVMELSSILEPDISEKIVAVYGMGFVGLTLAATLANEKFLVVGIDTNELVVENLKKGVPSFYEEGLESLVSSLLKNKQINFTSDGSEDADIHIISVGTPIDENNKPINAYIVEVTETIAKKLKSGDLVIFRSTVPVGTIRNIIIPILEKSGLVVGVDFYVSFAPERTVEGNALEELRSLPQIIGGYNHESYEQTIRLFSRVTNTIVEAESLEAAEMVKLLNNTFRDIVFSFSNEVSMICDELNINAFKLIEAANEGYPRNKIPNPSPGVGGLCLSKDPFLYTNPCVDIDYKPVLGNASRSINTQGPQTVLNKIKNFCNETDLDISRLKIYLIGLAFKGTPETSDIRDSMALRLIEMLPNKDNIYIKDHVVPKSLINETGCHYVNKIEDGFDDADVVLVMNNHHTNKHFNVSIELDRMSKPSMFFDGWNMFNQTEIENINGISYATMGYVSKK